jgi:hypothetical protein
VPFLADAVSYLVSFMSLLAIWREPLVRFLALLHGGVNLCGFGYTLILIVIAQQLGATAFETGLLLGAGGAAAVVGSVLFAPLNRILGRGGLLIASTRVPVLPRDASVDRSAWDPKGC